MIILSTNVKNGEGQSESVPRPIGPYAEHKEFDDLTQDSNIIAEKKENDDLR